MTDALVTEKPDNELDAANLLILRQMAESIRIAHEINPRSWAVYKVGGEVVLSVSIFYMLTTIRIQHSDFSLMIDSNAIESRFLELKSSDSPPSFPGVRLRIPMQSGSEYLGKLKNSHEEARRSATAFVKTNTHFWQQHDPTLVKEVAQAIGGSLPTPAYLEDIPSSAAIADSSDSAIMHQMAESIRIAHEINPRSWAVLERRGTVSLIVSKYIGLTTVYPQTAKATILVATDAIDPEMERDYSFYREPGALNAIPGTLFDLPTDQIQDALPRLRKAHLEAVEMAAKEVRTWSARANEHRPDMLRVIETATGERLPKPGYFDDDVVDVAPQARTVMELLQGSFANEGLFYTQLQLATFYTALQTKGFVVLSGISGTGKSKIAQQFASMLPEAETFLDDEPNASEGGDSDSFTVRIGRTTLTRHEFAVPLSSIPESDFPALGTSTYIPLTVNGKTAPCRFNHRLQPRGYQYSRLHIPPELREAVAKLTEGARYDVHIARDDSGKISGFELGNLNTSTRPSRTSQDSKTPNSLFLSVRPDWRDSRALIGYYNPLLNQYEWTDFLRFVIRAAENYWSEEPIAWFVILDEMNLAHVEYYFADLLSILESGRDDQGWTREAIRITVPELEDDADAPPSEIRLPPNLYFIGTVNMDETTHAFSPKVLDRAFTMELSDVDFSHYPQASDGDGCNLTEGESSQMLRAFTRDGRFAKIDKAEIGSIVTEYPNIRVWLQKLNELLAKSRMNFGYRVFDEIAQFIANAEENDGFASFEGFESAFDSAVLMKVLPKFSGSAARLERPLLDLLAWCVDPVRLPQKEIRDAQDGLGDRGWLESSYAEPGALFFPLTGKRAMRMLDALATEGFASFG